MSLNDGDDSVSDGTKTDTLKSVENLILSSKDDTIEINSLQAISELNSLDAKEGTDTLKINETMDLSDVSFSIVNIEKIEIASGKTATFRVEQISDKSVSGAGDILVKVDGDSNQDFNNITVTGSKTVEFTNDSIFGGDFRDLAVKIDSAKSLTVAIGKIYDKTVTNDGTIILTNLDQRSDADLSTIDGSVKVHSNTDVEFRGDLANAALTITNGTFTVDDAILGTRSVDGTGNLVVKTNDSSADLSNVNLSGSGLLTAVLGDGSDNVVLSSGDDKAQIATNSLTSNDTIDGGAGVDTLELTAGGTLSDSDFSNLSNFESLVMGNTANTVTLGSEAQDAGFRSIDAGGGNDTITLENSNITQINMGDGNDSIKLTSSILTNSTSYDGGSGNDTLEFTSSDTIDMTKLSKFYNIETIKMSSGDDSLIFADKTEFDSVIGEFDIVDSGGNDTVTFENSVSGDLDFGKLSEFETLKLSNGANDITLSGDEPSTVSSGSGDDTFTLDFSNVTNIDAGSGNDTAKLTGSATANDSDFSGAQNVKNIDTLDLSSLTIDGADDKEFIITKEMIQKWDDGDKKITLKITADQAENFQVTADDSADNSDDSSTVHSSLINNSTYTFSDGSELLVEVV